MTKTILVIGGARRLGQPVCRQPREAGLHARVMTRHPMRPSGTLGDSFETCARHPADAGRLAEALRGCAGVHIGVPASCEQPVAELAAKLAPMRGVGRITYISGATVDEAHRRFPMIDRKVRAGQAIRGGGTPCTILCPTWAMER